MKRYFKKKAFLWYLLFTILCEIILMLLMFIVGSVLPYGSVTRETAVWSASYVCKPVLTLVCVLAGNALVNKIQKDGEYEGEYGKYRYFFYPLASAATMLITSLSGLVHKGFGTAKEIMSRNEFAGGMVKAGLVTALDLALMVLEFVIISKVIGSLLCAVTDGEESEKRFFSKIGLPVCISLAGALIVDLLHLIFFDLGAISFISEILYLSLLALILSGLKYKFDDLRLRKIICNVLPFAYVGIQAIIAAVRIVSII